MFPKILPELLQEIYSHLSHWEKLGKTREILKRTGKNLDKQVLNMLKAILIELMKYRQIIFAKLALE